MHVEGTAVFTNTNPMRPYRGNGRPEAGYVMERMVDLAADELGIDPAELRRRNFVARGDLRVTGEAIDTERRARQRPRGALEGSMERAARDGARLQRREGARDRIRRLLNAPQAAAALAERPSPPRRPLRADPRADILEFGRSEDSLKARREAEEAGPTPGRALVRLPRQLPRCHFSKTTSRRCANLPLLGAMVALEPEDPP
jgi:hypothetical protein